MHIVYAASHSRLMDLDSGSRGARMPLEDLTQNSGERFVRNSHNGLLAELA